MSTPFQKHHLRNRKTAAQKHARRTHIIGQPGGDDEGNGGPKPGQGGYKKFPTYNSPTPPATPPRAPTTIDTPMGPAIQPPARTPRERRMDRLTTQGQPPPQPGSPGKPKSWSDTTTPSPKDAELNMPLIRIIDAQSWTAIVKVAELPPYIQEMDAAQLNPILNQFAQFLARELAGRVTRAISTQRFRRVFRPLAASTVKKKGHRNFWTDTRTLVRSITFWQEGREWRVGFRQGQRHPSGSPIVTIARANEYGTARIPARPVFIPEAEAIQRDIRKIMTTWLLRRGIGAT